MKRFQVSVQIPGGRVTVWGRCRKITSLMNPEAKARQQIDALLTAAGWAVQDRAAMNLYAGRGVAVREFPTDTGPADYLLFADRRAVGVIEAKPEGATLSGVAEQAADYAVNLPANIPHVSLPLPFLYASSRGETFLCY